MPRSVSDANERAASTDPRAPTATATAACRAASTTAAMQKLLGYNLAQAAIPSLKIFAKRIGEPFQLRRSTSRS